MAVSWSWFGRFGDQSGMLQAFNVRFLAQKRELVLDYRGAGS
jgi:hypothetical protein